MLVYIDQYCERTEPGLWSEPTNVVTNIVFVLAAWGVWRMVRLHRERHFVGSILTVLLLLIAGGSGLFHLIATEWALWCDVLPIGMFQVVFLWVYVSRIMKQSHALTVVVTGLFLVMIAVSRQWADWFNGSVTYFPALFFLFILALYHRLSQRQCPWLLMCAVCLFVFSLLMRSIDNWLCAKFPLGTHFIWHLCNGGVLYLSTRALLSNLEPDSAINIR